MTTPGDELARRIRLGEDSTLELKKVLLAGKRVTGPDRGRFADELAGMANGSGGTVVLGVEDETRDILGIPIDSLYIVETWARDICNDLIAPPLDATIRKLEIQSPSGDLIAVICIDVPRSLFVHRSPGGYFRRIGSSKREMSPELLARLFQERSQSRLIRFDESVVPRTGETDLDGWASSIGRCTVPAPGSDIDRCLPAEASDCSRGRGRRLTFDSRWCPHVYSRPR